MSECVVRMETPTENTACELNYYCYREWRCIIADKRCDHNKNGKFPSWCPIICSLPEGHGRLVDESDVIRLVNKWFDTIGLNPDIMIDGIKSLPTIVPADTAERSET